MKENKTTNTTITPEEAEGVEAILFLQAMVGIKEPEERALRNWRGFSESERQQTMDFYKLFTQR